MQVHVLVFEHEQGSDVSVHTNPAEARKKAAAIARESWAYAREKGTRPELPEEPPADDSDAIALYFQAMEERERFHVHTTQIDEGPMVVFEDQRLWALPISYVPFVADDGRVGFVVGDGAGRKEFIYLVAPTSEGPGGSHDVSVHHGEANDPRGDKRLHQYAVGKWPPHGHPG